MTEPQSREPLLEIEEILPILNKIALFGGLSDKQLYAVFRLLQKTHFARGEFIFEQGDAPSDIYIVWKGSVELVLDVGGTPLAETVFTTGDCFGEIAMVGIERHTASALAREDTELIVLPREGLFSFWDTDKELFAMLVLNIAREACRRLNQADQNLLHYFSHRD